ncbi:TIGR03364 family FAD-dependent oxidoreductase [Mobilicoccus massiliensis]|uniref:TIGR03364 family FAD-dependent oxidoreductase n=1 Tax=Mobilicoccus massiliensis TaxID=1522310 RepID=UPI00058D003E|nr:TIGR03364 family FAD-dependent oxidoreductase [Mobilicoccus massiliensis]
MSDAHSDLVSDLVIVGAGIVGLAHAAEAVSRGLSVQIVERDAAAVGASVRNFGHACVTAQVGELRDLAESSREGWLAAASRAGFWAAEAGAVVVARASDEMGVLEEFAAAEGDAVELLSAEETARRLGRGAHEGDPIRGGALLTRDLRVDPRTVVAELAAHLESVGVRIHWRHCVTGIEPGVVRTNRGDVRGERIVVAVGHDLDHLFPGVADAHELRRCRLSMALVDAPSLSTDAAVLTATSMLRYDGMAQTSAAGEVRARLERERPELLDVGANVMFTRRPDGTVLVGDSHHYDLATPPFLDEDVADALLAEVARVVGGSLRVRQRWQGVYASSPSTPLVRETPMSGVDVVTVSTGVGMTLAFGLARATLARM